jgi:hypothetical protein
MVAPVAMHSDQVLKTKKKKIAERRSAEKDTDKEP